MSFMLSPLSKQTKNLCNDDSHCRGNNESWKATKVAEEKEQVMLEAAEHIKMARVQRQLYQDKVDKARRTVGKIHSERTYTFVVDYGQNMELPVFNSEQPRAT